MQQRKLERAKAKMRREMAASAAFVHAPSSDAHEQEEEREEGEKPQQRKRQGVAGAKKTVSKLTDEEKETWVEKVDPKTGKKFYVNPKTRKSSWSLPMGAVSAAASLASAKNAQEWVEKVDKKSGQRYWANKETHETTWTKPAAMGE